MEITEQNIKNIIHKLQERSDYCEEEIKNALRHHVYSFVSLWSEGKRAYDDAIDIIRNEFLADNDKKF